MWIRQTVQNWWVRPKWIIGISPYPTFRGNKYGNQRT